MNYNKDIIARFHSKYIPEPNTGCWLWTGSLARKYGRLRTGKNGEGWAHRISFEIHKGEIPKGLFVLHKCDTPACVNPDHLWLGTIADNNKDKSLKKRTKNQNKTHCPRGHEYSYFWNGHRNCIICISDSSKKRYLRNKKQKNKDDYNYSSKSGYRGVHPYKNGKFFVRIQNKHRGIFDSAEEAAKHYDFIAVKIYGNNAVLNFPTKWTSTLYE